MITNRKKYKNTDTIILADYPSIRLKKITYLREDWRGRMRKDYDFEQVQHYDKELDEWVDTYLESTEHEVRMS